MNEKFSITLKAIKLLHDNIINSPDFYANTPLRLKPRLFPRSWANWVFLLGTWRVNNYRERFIMLATPPGGFGEYMRDICYLMLCLLCAERRAARVAGRAALGCWPWTPPRCSASPTTRSYSLNVSNTHSCSPLPFKCTNTLSVINVCVRTGLRHTLYCAVRLLMLQCTYFDSFSSTNCN